MNLSAYKEKYEPIDGKWYFTKELGSGAFGKVFEIERRDFTNDKSALKIISIPSSPAEVNSYREENYDLDEKSVSSYFYGFVEEFTKEFSLMTTLKGQNNVVRIEDYDVKEHTDEIGWDIFIRMELLTPMNKYLAQNAPKPKDVVKLGIDICKALEVCQKFNIIHRDIKPSNIFVSDTGEYKLGDFGVARTLEKTSSGLSKKGTYTYMAPEVFKGEAYNANVDIYSLGIVMYRLLNNNMEPFRTEKTYSDEENALGRRLRGDKMPAPANAEGKLAEIILKACSFNPAERYGTPTAMREELEALLYIDGEEKIIFSVSDNKAKNTPAPNASEQTVGIFGASKQVPRPEEKTDIGFNPAAAPSNASVPVYTPPVQKPAQAYVPPHNTYTPPAPKKTAKKKPWGVLFAILGAVAVLFAALIVVVLLIIGSSTPSTPVDEVNIGFEILVGESPDSLGLLVEDPGEYSVELEECGYLDENNSYMSMDGYEAFEFNKNYDISLKVTPNDGFVFDEETIFIVNGEEVSTSGDYVRVIELTIPSYDPTKVLVPVTYGYASEKISLGGYDTGYIELDAVVENCISLTTKLTINSVDVGNPYRDWDIYLRVPGGEFKKCTSFYFDEDIAGSNKSICVDIDMNSPTAFDAVAIVPATTEELTWGHSIDVMNVVVKR